MVVAFGLPLASGRAYALAGEHVAASVSDLDPRRVGEPWPAGHHRVPAEFVEPMVARALSLEPGEMRRLGYLVVGAVVQGLTAAPT